MVGRNILDHASAAQYSFHAPRRSELDLSDESATNDYLQRLKPDLVIHAAGRVGGIEANIAAPVSFLTENLIMGQNILLASRSAGVKRVLNLGSSCKYPRNFDTPLTEDMILQGELEPTNEGYALAKIAIQRLGRYITSEDKSCKYPSLIPCNLFGSYDNYAPESSHLLAAVIHKVHPAKLNNNPMVQIWGDGTARRDFLYPADFADMIFYAIENFEELPDLINVGVGKDYSVAEYYEKVAKAVGWEGQFEFDVTKPSGMRRKLLDVSRQEKFGWTPSTDIDTAIARTYASYLQESSLVA